jgi:hypothetical protein
MLWVLCGSIWKMFLRSAEALCVLRAKGKGERIENATSDSSRNLSG